MRALDTNILLRYLIKDDPIQAAIAREFILKCTSENRGFINLVTVNELVWALKKIYRYEKSLIIDTIEKILEAEQLQVENSEVVLLALEDFRKHNVDFADALIGVINQYAGFAPTATFDKKAAKLDTFALLA